MGVSGVVFEPGEQAGSACAAANEPVRDQIALGVHSDENYKGICPELPWLDAFLLGSTDPATHDGEIGAFVRQGLHRSFTARKVRILWESGACRMWMNPRTR